MTKTYINNNSNIKRGVLVTGANSGLGFETCRQLAILGITDIFVAARSVEKANGAIDKLVKLTEKPRNIFIPIIFDVSDVASSIKAANSLELGSLNAVILNAGIMTTENAYKTHKSGTSNLFATNVLGQLAFTMTIVENGALSKEGIVMFSSSELARGVPMMGKAPIYPENYTIADIKDIITLKSIKNLKDQQMEMYGYVKSIGTLSLMSLQRKYPNFKFISISPGFTTGTSISDTMTSFERFQIYISSLFGLSHNVYKGAERYLASLNLKTNLTKKNESILPGKFYGSTKYSLTGKMIDQSTILPIYEDEKLQNYCLEATTYFIKPYLSN